MKPKYIETRMKQVLLLAECSKCPRAKFAALILDPLRNVVLMDGFNGNARGDPGDLCNGSSCIRDELRIQSGTRCEQGCFHAEMNCILNCAAGGVKTAGAWMIVNGPPCLMCSKMILHAAIKKVIVIKGAYSTNEGIDFLRKRNVEVEEMERPI